MPTDEVPDMVRDMVPEPSRVVNMISVGLGPDTWVTVWAVDSLKEAEDTFKRILANMQKKGAALLARQGRPLEPDVR